jgi:hypothetical protein
MLARFTQKIDEPEVASRMFAELLDDCAGRLDADHPDTLEVRLQGLRTGRAWRSFDQTAILVTGTGGAGKTYLLCDLAKIRTVNNLPTIIVLGEKFERGPIETDLGRISGFNSAPVGGSECREVPGAGARRRSPDRRRLTARAPRPLSGRRQARADRRDRRIGRC